MIDLTDIFIVLWFVNRDVNITIFNEREYSHVKIFKILCLIRDRKHSE